jgi:hypothetical protein
MRSALLLVLLPATIGTGSCRRETWEGPVAVDPPEIHRHLGKQPRYVCARPLYGILVLGPKRTHVWMVFDKSAPASRVYDVLYFDRNANGDLTDPGERIGGKQEGKDSLVFRVGSFKDPATGEVHTGVALQTWLNEKDADRNPFTVDIHLKWNGKEPVHCGFDERPSLRCQFTDNPASAPVYRLGGDAPLCVNRWGWDKLTIGRSQDIRVLLGYRGIGGGSFAALSDHYLPADVPILATLFYTDLGGRERRVRTKIRERC